MSIQKLVQGVVLLSIVCASIPGRADGTLSSKAADLVEIAKQGAVVAQIKAALMDRKDIRSRYIRVRYDGKTIQLAGFVKDAKQGELVAELAKRQEDSAEVATFWAYEQELEERDAYTTRVGEQVSDAEIWAKVRASLFSPVAKAVLEQANVQAVDVRHGKVRVFLILDGPPEDIDISPYVKPIHDVVEVTCRIVKTFGDPRP
jgi:osmotically-inducible protein OsmY